MTERHETGIPSPYSAESFISYWILLPFRDSVEPRELEIVGSAVGCLLFEHTAELESVEVDECIVMHVLIVPEEDPTEFAEAFIDQCSHVDISVEDRFAVFTSKPTESEIQVFMNND